MVSESKSVNYTVVPVYLCLLSTNMLSVNDIAVQSSEIRTVCAEGFAKLLLAGRVVSPSLLTRLLLLWYNPVTEDDTKLRHCIGTFLPIYAFASRWPDCFI